MYWFAIASLTPAAILLMACVMGGMWAWGALACITVFVTLADRLPRIDPNMTEGGKADKFARQLAVILGFVHFTLLLVGVRTIATSDNLNVIQTLALTVALGVFFGQVSNSNAHELIHASDRWLRRLGIAIYISILFGHHASAHPKVHHVHVATPDDPNSAPLGRGFYAFWPRAWIGSFRAGLRAETAARARMTVRPVARSHPYVGYVAGAIIALWLAWMLAGLAGVAVYIVLAGYAQMQLLLADYIQHYGLRRTVDENGTPEPAGLQHSWNASHWYSSFMMLNAPRHSDHHMHPSRVFPELRLDTDVMPMLPSSLPGMAAVALIPPLWRAIMDPRVARWQTVATPN